VDLVKRGGSRPKRWERDLARSRRLEEGKTQERRYGAPATRPEGTTSGWLGLMSMSLVGVRKTRGGERG
jgi:hypothetical protein